MIINALGTYLKERLFGGANLEWQLNQTRVFIKKKRKKKKNNKMSDKYIFLLQKYTNIIVLETSLSWYYVKINLTNQFWDHKNSSFPFDQISTQFWFGVWTDLGVYSDVGAFKEFSSQDEARIQTGCLIGPWGVIIYILCIS